MKSVIGLSILFFFLQAKLWLGTGSVLDLQNLNQRIVQQKIENTRLAERNRQLAAEIKMLQQEMLSPENHTRIEDYARWKLGMIKPKEILYEW